MDECCKPDFLDRLARKQGLWDYGDSRFRPGLENLLESMAHIWQPLFLGSVFCGAVAGVIGYIGLRLLWRLHVVGEWKKRRRPQKNQRSSSRQT